MQTNERMVREELSGLDFLQAIVDGKAPIPPMARTIPMTIVSVAPGEVIFTADEPTGGTHMTLVLAGSLGCSFEEAERIKKDPKQEMLVFPVVKPVIEKMAAIVARFIQGYDVDVIYVVGGACSFKKFESVFEKETGVKTIKPKEPLLVTPLGIAMNCNKQ